MNVAKGLVTYLHCGSTSAIDIRFKNMPKGIRSFRIPFGTDYTGPMVTIASLALNKGCELEVRYNDQQQGAEYAEITELLVQSAT